MYDTILYMATGTELALHAQYNIRVYVVAARGGRHVTLQLFCMHTYMHTCKPSSGYRSLFIESRTSPVILGKISGRIQYDVLLVYDFFFKPTNSS